MAQTKTTKAARKPKAPAPKAKTYKQRAEEAEARATEWQELANQWRNRCQSKDDEIVSLGGRLARAEKRLATKG